MHRSALSVALALSLGVATLTANAADFSSLEERMSGDEFNAAGLDRLSPEELARLNDWLRAHWPAMPAASTPYPAQADTRGLSQPAASRDAIVSKLEGEFTGWSSSTVFRLENGMVWQAADSSGRFSVPAIQNPTVIIEPAMLGTWLLRIEGYNATVRVRRVE